MPEILIMIIVYSKEMEKKNIYITNYSLGYEGKKWSLSHPYTKYV